MHNWYIGYYYLSSLVPSPHPGLEDPGNESTTGTVSVCHAVQLFTLGLLQEVVLSSVRVDHLQLVRQRLVETGLWELVLHPGHHEEDGEWQSCSHSQWKFGVR